MDRIRVMLADDEPEILELMTEVVSSDPSIDVVGTARDATSAIDLARLEVPDVALVDVRMPGGGGTHVARLLRSGSLATRVVAVSAFTNPDIVVGMLKAGAVGYVAKDADPHELLRAIHRSVEGHGSLSVGSPAEIAERLAEQLSAPGSAARNLTADKIASAIAGPSLHMVYQPIVELRAGHVVGVEALARFMERPRRLPSAWFAAAAEVGLLTDLELAAVRRALAELDRLPLGTYLTVNVSPETLMADGVADLFDGASAERIVLEVTEQSKVEDYDGLITRLEPIRARGVRLAIDDVGAGFASLGHVVRLQPDFMKIDRTLVAGVAADPVRSSLIERLVAFADECGIAVIAEGIENTGDFDTLRALHVPYGQGFHLGRPGPIPEAQNVWPIRWPGRHAFRSISARADLRQSDAGRSVRRSVARSAAAD
jgi:EAL domain-containing protein (putative c-di-GMP-specific phosphodiesterase class I)/DNA-binding NarL/FixJ family response regulator